MPCSLKHSSQIKISWLLFCLCAHMCFCMHVTACAWRPENNLKESELSFAPWVLENKLRLGSYSLSLPTSPQINSLCKWDMCIHLISRLVCFPIWWMVKVYVYPKKVFPKIALQFIISKCLCILRLFIPRALKNFRQKVVTETCLNSSSGT